MTRGGHTQEQIIRKLAEGKAPRQARSALARHVANVVYRRMLAWAETTHPASTT
jgi:hypothetical protein